MVSQSLWGVKIKWLEMGAVADRTRSLSAMTINALMEEITASNDLGIMTAL